MAFKPSGAANSAKAMVSASGSRSASAADGAVTPTQAAQTITFKCGADFCGDCPWEC